MNITRCLSATFALVVAMTAAGPGFAQVGGAEIAYCVDRKTMLSTVPESQMKMSFPASCMLSKAGSARAFLEINYGGVNKDCRC